MRIPSNEYDLDSSHCKINQARRQPVYFRALFHKNVMTIVIRITKCIIADMDLSIPLSHFPQQLCRIFPTIFHSLAPKCCDCSVLDMIQQWLAMFLLHSSSHSNRECKWLLNDSDRMMDVAVDFWLWSNEIRWKCLAFFCEKKIIFCFTQEQLKFT